MSKLEKYNTVGFRESFRQIVQNYNSDVFVRLPVSGTHCNIGTEKTPEVSIISIYADDILSQ